MWFLTQACQQMSSQIRGVLSTTLLHQRKQRHEAQTIMHESKSVVASLSYYKLHMRMVLQLRAGKLGIISGDCFSPQSVVSTTFAEAEMILQEAILHMFHLKSRRKCSAVLYNKTNLKWLPEPR